MATSVASWSVVLAATGAEKQRVSFSFFNRNSNTRIPRITKFAILMKNWSVSSSVVAWLVAAWKWSMIAGKWLMWACKCSH